MKYRNFSNTGWKVSEIGLGCWQLGWSWGDLLSEKTVSEILNNSIERGINFFDTSDVYGDGRSEKFLSKIIKESKEENNIIVTTKLGRRHKNTPFGRDKYPLGIYNEEALEYFLDRSLKNLQVEKIDLLQLHCPPINVCRNPEIYDGLDNLVKKGKIIHYGVSVYYLSEAYEVLKMPNVKSIQIHFNPIRQKPNENFFKIAKQKNVAIIIRGAFASGVLTGNLKKNQKFQINDHRNFNIHGESHNISETFSGVKYEECIEFVEELKKKIPKDMKISHLVLKWIHSYKEVSTVIPGALNKDQSIQNSIVSDFNEKDYKDLFPFIDHLYKNLLKNKYHDMWD